MTFSSNLILIKLNSTSDSIATLFSNSYFQYHYNIALNAATISFLPPPTTSNAYFLPSRHASLPVAAAGFKRFASVFIILHFIVGLVHN